MTERAPLTQTVPLPDLYCIGIASFETKNGRSDADVTVFLHTDVGQVGKCSILVTIEIVSIEIFSFWPKSLTVVVHYPSQSVTLNLSSSFLGYFYLWFLYLTIKENDTLYVPVKSKLQHPPRATPRAFEFLENVCSNSPLTGSKSCSNAPTPGGN